MAQKSNPPRKAVSTKYRTNPVKKEKEAVNDEELEQEEVAHEQPESLAEEELAPEDSFVMLSSQIVDWIVKNRAPVIGLMGAMLLAGLGGSLYSGYAQSKEVDLASENYKAMSDLPGFSIKPVNDVDDATYKAAAQKLTTIASANSGTVGGEYAAIYAGHSYLQAKDSSAAIQAFSGASANAKNPTFKAFAMGGLAASQSIAGDEAAVVETQKQRVAQLTGVWKESALLDLGRTLEGVSKTQEAASTYEQLVKDFPYSPFVDDAKDRLSTIKPESSVLKASADEAKASE